MTKESLCVLRVDGMAGWRVFGERKVLLRTYDRLPEATARGPKRWTPGTFLHTERQLVVWHTACSLTNTRRLTGHVIFSRELA